MARKPARGKPTGQLHGRRDPLGEEWQAQADAAFARVIELVPEHDPSARDLAWSRLRPPLPAFPALEGRGALGQYAYDPATDLVHDIAAATPACAIPAPPAALVVVHFAHELEGALPATAQPHECMGE